jgi:hypothetical protein
MRASVQRPRILWPKISTSSVPRSSWVSGASDFAERYQPWSHTMTAPAP